MYNYEENILCSQSLSHIYFKRFCGAIMYRSSDNKYSPFKKADALSDDWQLNYYNFFLDDDFCGIKSFAIDLSKFNTIDIYNKQIKFPDKEIEFRGFDFKSFKKKLGEKFFVGFELGNEIVITKEYPRLKHFSMDQFYYSNTREQEFRRDVFKSRNFKVGYDSYQKMAEDELKDLDDKYPGWSMGIWD